MASDEILSQWAQVSAPVTPSTTQDWVILVNSDRWPTLADQKRAIESVIKRVGGQNVRFERFSNTQILPTKPRVRRETIPNIDFVPTLRGKPVWWLVKWDFFGTEDAVTWPAEQHGIIGRDVDPLEADVLLAAVGGEQHEATPEPSLGDRIEGIADDFKEGAQTVGTGLLVVGIVAGGLYLATVLGNNRGKGNGRP